MGQKRSRLYKETTNEMNFPHLQKVMEEYAMYLQLAARKNMPDYYKLKDNISFTVDIDGNFYNILFKAPEYWKYAEYGRKAGKWPPITAIEKWIDIRHITPYPSSRGVLPTKKQLAFLIARSIGEKGTLTTPVYFLGRSLDEDRAYWNDQIDKAITEDVYDNVDVLLKLHR